MGIKAFFLSSLTFAFFTATPVTQASETVSSAGATINNTGAQEDKSCSLEDYKKIAASLLVSLKFKNPEFSAMGDSDDIKQKYVHASQALRFLADRPEAPCVHISAFHGQWIDSYIFNGNRGTIEISFRREASLPGQVWPSANFAE